MICSRRAIGASIAVREALARVAGLAPTVPLWFVAATARVRRRRRPARRQMRSSSGLQHRHAGPGQDELARLPIRSTKFNSSICAWNRAAASRARIAWHTMVESVPFSSCAPWRAAVSVGTPGGGARQIGLIGADTPCATRLDAIPCIAFAAQLCADLDDIEHAPALYDLSSPYAASHSNGRTTSVRCHHLGRRRDDRKQRACGGAFRAALIAHRRMWARCWQRARSTTAFLSPTARPATSIARTCCARRQSAPARSA